MKKETKCLFEIHTYEWYQDIKGRIWVVTGFWYENDQKVRVDLLQLGKSSWITQPYDVVLQEIKAGKMKIIIANT